MIYDIAGLRINIKNRLSYTTKFCEGYLSRNQISDANITVEITDEDFFTEKNGSQGFSDGYIENLCIYRKICNAMPDFDRFLFHCSAIEYDGAAYAFSGRSGAGKSTHSKLWIEYLDGAKFLNGDKPIIGYENGEFYVYGTPWQGKEGFGYNGKVKLKNVCFIEQSSVNSISRISESQFADRLFSQTLMPSSADGVGKTLELMNEMVTRVPAYVLNCDISKEAFETSYNVMVKGNGAV